MFLISHPKKDNRQLSIIDAFGIRSNQPCHFRNEVDAHPPKDNESNSVELVEGEQPSKKLNITFKSKWKTRFPWAYVVKTL
jgi:hypothetical protein